MVRPAPMQQQHIDRLAATQVRWAAVPGAPGAPEPNQPPPRPSRTTTAPPSNQLFGLHCPSLASDLKLKCISMDSALILYAAKWKRLGPQDALHGLGEHVVTADVPSTRSIRDSSTSAVQRISALGRPYTQL